MNETTSTTHGGTAADATHYQTLAQQPIEIMQRLMTKEQFLGFCHGNVIKYALRCGHKDDPAKEMEKVRQYADWYVRAANGETIDPRSEAHFFKLTPPFDFSRAKRSAASWIDCVKEFNAAYGIEAPTGDIHSIMMQRGLIKEEYTELRRALNGYRDFGNRGTILRGYETDRETLDALCDLIYVCIGMALKLGFDLDGAFREVHRSNMSKLGEDGKPIKRDDGKILKGPNFTPPDLTPYINSKEDE